MTTYAKLGWLDTIVNVNWGKPYYTLLDLFVDVTSDPSQSIQVVPAKGVKIKFTRDQKIDTSPVGSSFPIAYVTAQSMPFPTDEQNYHVNCVGWGSFWPGTGFASIGYADPAVAWSHAAEDNGIVGAWYNSGSTPSSAKTAWNGMPADLATDPAFSGIPVGPFADAGVAGAFADAVMTHVGAGGWMNSMPDIQVTASPPSQCQSIISATFYPSWFPTILTATVTTSHPPNVLREFIMLLEGTSTGTKQKVCDVYLRNGSFNTFAYTFLKETHELDATNTDRNPLSAPNGRVYFPLSPSSGEKDYSAGLDAGGHRQVFIKDGMLTIL